MKILILLVIIPFSSFAQIDSTGTFITFSSISGFEYFSLKDFWRASTFRNDFKDIRRSELNFTASIGTKKMLNSKVYGINIGPSLFYQSPINQLSIGLTVSGSLSFKRQIFLRSSIGKGFIINETELFKSITIGTVVYNKKAPKGSVVIPIGLTLIHTDKFFWGFSGQIPFRIGVK